MLGLLFTLPLLFSAVFSHLSAHDPAVRLFGHVHGPGTHIQFARVMAADMDQPSFMISCTADSAGYYSLSLPYDRLYKVSVEADGSVGRFVYIDLRNIPFADKERGYDLLMDPILFPVKDGVDLEFFSEEAAGICLYDPKTRSLYWDPSYIASMKKLVQEVLDEDATK